MTKFETLTEEEKIEKIFGYALQKCQESLTIFPHPHFAAYRAELKATIDWIAIALNMQNCCLYWNEDDEIKS